MSWLSFIAGMRSEEDARTASETELRLLGDEAASASGVDHVTRAALTDPHGLRLGMSLESGEAIRVPITKALGHWGIWGPSGVGKSYALIALLGAFISGAARSLLVFDPKGETIELMGRLILDHASRLPRAAREALLDRVILVDLFSNRLLPGFNVLHCPGTDPELHAWVIATLVTSAAGSDVGVRQETILHRSIECLIRAHLPLTILPLVLAEPSLLPLLSTEKIFRDTAVLLGREKRDRLQGIAARVERLLRLRATRLMMGAPSCLDFGTLMTGHIVLVNLAPPFGSTDVGRFVAGALWHRVMSGILSRPNGSSPTVVAIDEWPEFLAGSGGDAAASCERLLRLARSKGVSLMFLSQDMASIGSVSPALPQIVHTNIHWHLVFRTTEDWRFAIRPTGRRLARPGAPWEPQDGRYLSRGEEGALLADELASLPDRTAYLVARRYGTMPVRVRTDDLRIHARDVDVLGARAAARSALIPTAALERHAVALEARLHALVRQRAPLALSSSSALRLPPVTMARALSAGTGASATGRTPTRPAAARSSSSAPPPSAASSRLAIAHHASTRPPSKGKKRAPIDLG